MTLKNAREALEDAEINLQHLETVKDDAEGFRAFFRSTLLVANAAQDIAAKESKNRNQKSHELRKFISSEESGDLPLAMTDLRNRVVHLKRTSHTFQRSTHQVAGASVVTTEYLEALERGEQPEYHHETPLPVPPDSTTWFFRGADQKGRDVLNGRDVMVKLHEYFDWLRRFVAECERLADDT